MGIEWKEYLSSGIRWIDDQHKCFFKKIDIFLEDIQANKGSVESVTALKEVEDYVHFHFSTEERYMLQYDYQNRKLHMSQHKIYRKKFEKLKTKYGIEEASTDFLREFQLSIIDWYMNHIQKHDKKLADYLSEKVDK
ncbi:bacteriohemerythrin [candidate division KSB1 bacterium]